jgi:hypothetical protein
VVLWWWERLHCSGGHCCRILYCRRCSGHALQGMDAVGAVLNQHLIYQWQELSWWVLWWWELGCSGGYCSGHTWYYLYLGRALMHLYLAIQTLLIPHGRGGTALLMAHCNGNSRGDVIEACNMAGSLKWVSRSRNSHGLTFPPPLLQIQPKLHTVNHVAPSAPGLKKN